MNDNADGISTPLTLLKPIRLTKYVDVTLLAFTTGHTRVSVCGPLYAYAKDQESWHAMLPVEYDEYVLFIGVIVKQSESPAHVVFGDPAVVPNILNTLNGAPMQPPPLM